MLILITGGTGSIGKKLIEKLQNSGYRLRILSRKKTESEASASGNFEYIKGNLENSDNLDKAVENADGVIHLAGITHTNDFKMYFKINAEGTKNLTEACRRKGVKKFIYISSRTACEEGGAYAQSKLLAEKIVKESGLDWTILRPSEVYGTKEKEAISRLISIVKKSLFVPIIGNGRYLLSPVYIDDLVQSILSALKNNSSIKKTYIIAGPEELTYVELVDKISKILGVKRIKIFIPVIFFKLLAFLFGFLGSNTLVRDQIPRLLCKKSADISSAKQELNFNPRTVENGIKIIINNKQ